MIYLTQSVCIQLGLIAVPPSRKGSNSKRGEDSGVSGNGGTSAPQSGIAGLLRLSLKKKYEQKVS